MEESAGGESRKSPGLTKERHSQTKTFAKSMILRGP